MGWLWGSSSSSKDPNNNPSDPLSHLDPTLRDFLLKESPLKPSPPLLPPPPPEQKTRETETGPEASANPRTRKSAYGDRYADIWEQYTPQGVTEASKSSQEQLADILQAYKYRKSLIARAALENCSGEQFVLHECYRNGSVGQRVRKCGAENRRLQDCYTTQTKFLQAMGYMSNFSRDPEVDERIQMHADKLYQEQLRQDEVAEAEKKAERAARENKPLES